MVTSFTLEEAKRVWLISDTHFDHTNVIKYSNRPFHSTEEMNNFMLSNWNNTVASDDLVYFLGDMSFGRGSRKPRWWVAQLNGKKIWIKGSHDHGIRPTSVLVGVRIVLSDWIVVDNLTFLLVHDYATVDDWIGWVIHGHNHNDRPFIDISKKKVNVSVEVIGYKPISLAQIVSEIHRNQT